MASVVGIVFGVIFGVALLGVLGYILVTKLAGKSAPFILFHLSNVQIRRRRCRVKLR